MAELTDYIVLKASGSGAESWAVVNSLAARDADAAVTATYLKLDESRDPASAPATATFVAVPYRSWKRKTVNPKVEMTLSVEEAN